MTPKNDEPVTDEPATVQNVDTDTETDVLSDDQQQMFLHLLARGASPAAACQQVGVPVATLEHTLNQQSEFQNRVREVYLSLSGNVAAAMYRAAMEGNVSAQTFWLRNRPPPDWLSQNTELESPATFDELFDQLTHDQLIQLARAMGIDLPTESR